MYYKKLNTDSSINMIGTQDKLPTDAVEITETEYKELYQYIQDNAVHITDAAIEESETTE